MGRKVKCVKLERELEGMPYKPFDNELGQRIYDHVSMDAWKMWLEYSKMMINEYHLDLTTPKAREALLEQCERFFFGEAAAPPPDYKPE